ncbi:beta-amyrin 11-oxidase-like [Cucumis melo var. makuwa]|uniref:Beta-amyrin 11-oxidase-like n=1 Tax=Cucumis melo var. makuwa TaxID=1194695 RepID=A0A5D3E5N1_CUCMM|nr:beta-amyrin 11-oxidase-like [Cucumis melo var. makuwa]TYK31139.1 beta-amyrin 11-oxidase-like [Cucumis melo var. makuwa]
MASSLNGYEILSKHVSFIDEIMSKGLEEWSTMKEPIELLSEIGSLLFKAIVRIFLGNEIPIPTLNKLEAMYKHLGPAILSILPYDLPVTQGKKRDRKYLRLCDRGKKKSSRKEERNEGSISAMPNGQTNCGNR